MDSVDVFYCRFVIAQLDERTGKIREPAVV